VTEKTDVPPGLGEAGTRLYTEFLDDIAPGYELDRRDLELLARAATVADDIETLTRVVEAEGPTAIGSRGQSVISPSLVELRHQRTLLMRLLGAIDIPADDPVLSPAQRRAKRAADARWSRGRTVQLRGGK
jgi:hypothetical protein